jgi:chromosome segregation ATPase
VAASPADGDARIREALAASSRAEASLGALRRAVEDASSGLAGTRQANEVLVGELGHVQEQLHQSETTRRELERVEQVLTHERDQAQLALAQAQEEREQVLNEHDDFLASLIEEHDEELGTMRQQLEASIAERAALVEEARAEGATRVEQLRKQHLVEISMLRRERDNELAALKKEHAKQAEAAGRSTRERLQASVPGLGDPAEMERLQRQLAESRQQVESLIREREQSRRMLRRLQIQRDEAHERANALERQRTQEVGPADVAEAAPDVTADGPTHSKTPPRESELALALAATDPRKRRRRSRRPATPAQGSARAPEGKPHASLRSLAGQSGSDVESEDPTRPPRRS